MLFKKFTLNLIKLTLGISYYCNTYFSISHIVSSFYNDKRLLASEEKYSATMLHMEKFSPQKCWHPRQKLEKAVFMESLGKFNPASSLLQIQSGQVSILMTLH